MGRPTWVKPAQEGWTQYTYSNAVGSTPAKAFINRRTNGGGTVLAYEEAHFDPFGRLAVERKRMANGTLSDRKTFYNALGSVTAKTEWGTAASTTYSEFDAFGRPGRIRPPDGAAHDVTLSYLGVRQVARTVRVGTAWNGSSVTETAATTTEIYDRQGRLYQVFEPANADGTSSTTTYAYDGREGRVSGRDTAFAVNGGPSESFIHHLDRGSLDRAGLDRRDEVLPDRGRSPGEGRPDRALRPRGIRAVERQNRTPQL